MALEGALSSKGLSGCFGLNVKCPSQGHVLEQLVYGWCRCLEGGPLLEEMVTWGGY